MGREGDRALEAVFFELGERAISDAAERAHQVCAWEMQEIGATVEPEQIAIQARLAVISREQEEIRGALEKFPIAALYANRPLAVFRWAAVCILIPACFALAFMTFAPFGLGWASWVFSLGASVALIVSAHGFISKLAESRVLVALWGIAFATGLVALFMMAMLRGDVFAFYLKMTIQTATGSASPEDALAFYRDASPILKATFGLLTLAMDLAAGLVFHEALEQHSGERHAILFLRRALAELQKEGIGLARRFAENHNRTRARQAALMREFHRGLSHSVRNISRSITTFALFLSLLVHLRAQTIAGIDASGSMLSRAPGGGTAFAESFGCLAEAVDSLPPGGQFAVYAITSNSFSQPLLMLSRFVPKDRGPLQFIDQTVLAKNSIRSDLVRQKDRVHADVAGSDILGFLVYAGAIFRESQERQKILLIFSDMRQNTPGIDLERRSEIDSSRAFADVGRRRLIADLRDVRVYVAGVHAAGKTVGYWQSLRAFWEEYFRRSGATLGGFSMGCGPRRNP